MLFDFVNDIMVETCPTSKGIATLRFLLYNPLRVFRAYLQGIETWSNIIKNGRQTRFRAYLQGIETLIFILGGAGWGGGFEPTYKELKPLSFTDGEYRIRSFEPTYKELKLKNCLQGVFDMVYVSSLPTRN